ncbi:vinorine synthase-like [Quillaja saponaria]|uniref:Vinorine synthase-like n=1 Tax=Quillaja saponaria TaxID=32244 RepID=A0AAD7PTJ8_QUISA|nr:vinorine synthase-like [Quillaja saponaria]
MVIGVCVSHMVADGTALTTFLKGWAATTRNSYDVVCPNFEAGTIFPQINEYTIDATMDALIGSFFKVGICKTKRFVFDAVATATLKAKAAGSNVPHPTRVEAVSALLSKCIRNAFKAKANVQRPTVVTHAVKYATQSGSSITRNFYRQFRLLGCFSMYG